MIVRWTLPARIGARDAFDWYNERNPLAAVKFIAELDAAMALLQEAPRRWPVWRAPYRRIRFKRFPYHLIYEVSEDEGIVVASVRHQQRDPDADIRG